MLWRRVQPPASALLTTSYSFFYPDKPGSCPNVDIAFPQLGLCRDQCQVDSQCPDALKCCINGCGRVSCVTPVF